MSGTAEAFDMPMAEAIAYLRQKVRLPTHRWTDIEGRGHTRAFAVAGVVRDDLLSGLKGALMRALEEGTTLAQFKRDIAPIMDGLGWRERGRAYEAWRTRLVYQTNLNTAYAAGRYAQMTEPDTLEALPFWVYRHSRKRDPRPQHVRWDGKVLPASSDWWRTHYPPNGWGCGCWVEAISRRELQASGKDGPDEPPRDGERPWTDPVTGERVMVPAGIDPGWAHNHGEGWLRGVVPQELREDLRPLADAASRQVPAALPPMPPARPIDPSRMLPDGLSDRQYAEAFLAEFGATWDRAALVRDVTGARLVVGRALFEVRDEAGNPTGAVKASKRRRGEWMRVLADALRDPDEVWADWVQTPTGDVVLRRRYLRRGARANRETGPLTVFTWISRGWSGTTTFPGSQRYLDAERSGVLLYRRGEGGRE